MGTTDKLLPALPSPTPPSPKETIWHPIIESGKQLKPNAFCNELKKRYNLKLKGVGPLEYHLGCTYKKDPDGTLAADPRRYVNKILESYERMFKEKPRKSRPPLEGGDHPELDTSELCDEHQTKQFQALIGQPQWLISLGCLDIAVHVMSLSRFRAQPRKARLDRAKRIV